MNVIFMGQRTVTRGVKTLVPEDRFAARAIKITIYL